MFLRNIKKEVYNSVFKAIYGFDDHIVRVLLIMLNLWWLFREILYWRGLSYPLGLTLTFYSSLSLMVSVFAALIGFGVLVFRASTPLINLNYLVTVLLLLMGFSKYLFLQPIVYPELGLFAVLTGIVIIEYFRYNIRKQSSFSGMYKKAQVDLNRESVNISLISTPKVEIKDKGHFPT